MTLDSLQRMKKYAVGDAVYLVENHRDMHAGVVNRISSDLYTFHFGYESAIRVHGSRLFVSAEDAAEQLPEYLRPGYKKTPWRWWLE